MIIFEHVSKIYSNGVKGLDQVDLSIGDGELVAVIGLSGAGKSTFLRSINVCMILRKGIYVSTMSR